MYTIVKPQEVSFDFMIKSTMKTTITFFGIILHLFVLGQKEIKTYYDPYQKTKISERYTINSKNQKHGKYVKYDDRGLKALEINYVNGKPHGVAYEYALPLVGFPGDEKLQKEVNYINGEKHGKSSYFLYLKDGQQNLKEGKKTLQGEEFYENGKKIREIAYFANGKKEIDSYLENGVQQKWYDNGQLAIELHVINGVYNGTWKEWYTNGQIGIDGVKKEGKFFGEKKEYYNTGKIKSRENYTIGDYNGVIFDGLQQYFDSTGTLSKDYYYEKLSNGKQIRRGTEYYSNGNKKEEYQESVTNRSAGNATIKLEGPYTNYYLNGKINETGMINEKEQREGLWKKFNESGELIYESTFSNGYRAGDWTIYLNNEKLEVEEKSQAQFYRKIHFSSEGGLTSEVVTDYFITGEKQFEGQLIDLNPDVLQGKCKFFYKNGKIQSEGEMNLGKKNGVWIENYESGNIKLSSNYIQETKMINDGYNGMRKNTEELPHGTWIYYYENGEKQKKEVYSNGKLINTKEFERK